VQRGKYINLFAAGDNHAAYEKIGNTGRKYPPQKRQGRAIWNVLLHKMWPMNEQRVRDRGL